MNRKAGMLICIAVIGISLLLVHSAAFGADQVIKLTFGSASSKGLPTYTALEKWGEHVQQRAQGRVAPILEANPVPDGRPGAALESTIRSLFRDIQSEVLDKLEGIKGFLAMRTKAIPSDPFDKRRANKRLRDRAKPLQRESVRRGGAEVLAEIAFRASFDMESPAVTAILALVERKITRINDTIEAALNDKLSELVNQEGGTSLDELIDGVREVMDASMSRARTIARTEVGNAYTGARFEGMKRAGVERHEWLSSGDEDVRPSHQLDVGGEPEVVVVGEPFSTGFCTRTTRTARPRKSSTVGA